MKMMLLSCHHPIFFWVHQCQIWTGLFLQHVLPNCLLVGVHAGETPDLAACDVDRQKRYLSSCGLNCVTVFLSRQGYIRSSILSCTQ